MAETKGYIKNCYLMWMQPLLFIVLFLKSV